MNKILLILFLSGIYSLFPDLAAQYTYPPVMEDAEEVVYKKINGIDLKLWIFYPEDHSMEDRRAAIVFFFGGGWAQGNPAQFEKHCEYLASRGMVAITADYRVLSRHNVKATKCISDAKSAIRWVRQHSTELGIDPNRIAAGGGSAGGHLAASTAALPEFDEPSESRSISSGPNALVLFNPALILAPSKDLPQNLQRNPEVIKERFAAEPQDISPYHHIKPGLPSAIIFHGTSDTTVDIETTRLFSEKMQRNGVSCTLVAYKGEKHAFFNFGKNDNGPFIDTVNKMDEFLVSLGFLTPPPETYIIE